MNGQLVIPVQKRPLDNFGHPLAFLTDIAGKINSHAPASVLFDFSGCLFIHPFVLCGISAFCSILENRHINCQFKGLENPALSGYFAVTGFPAGFHMQHEDEIIRLYNKTYVPLSIFPALRGYESIKDQVIDALSNIIRRQCNLSTQVFQALQYFLAELSQNITDHSGADKGFVFAQFYRSKQYLDLCIADTGIGLMQSYINSGRRQPQDHCEAMNLALNGASTKDLPESRGFGISTTRSMLIGGLSGKFFMWSGNAVAYQSKENLNIAALNPEQQFEGVYLALRIPVSHSHEFNLYHYVG